MTALLPRLPEAPPDVQTADMFPTPEACTLAGITKRQVHYWVGWRIVTPTGDLGNRGYRWDSAAIRVLRVVGQLAEVTSQHTEVTSQHTGRASRTFADFCDWQLLAYLVSTHTTGWLLIAPGDGRMGVTDQPEQLYAWQTTAKVSITVSLSDPADNPRSARPETAAAPTVEHGRGAAATHTNEHPGPITAGVS